MKYIIKTLDEKLSISGDDPLPTSMILAKVDLTECYLMVDDDYLEQIGVLEWEKLSAKHPLLKETDIGFSEWHFGDFSPGRFAFKMENPKLLTGIDSVRGQQGIWNYGSEIVNV